jgi:hypothetical protein
MVLGKCFLHAAENAVSLGPFETAEGATYMYLKSYEYFQLAGGTDAKYMPAGATSYSARSVDAMVTIGKLFDDGRINGNSGTDREQPVMAKLWYTEALFTGWIPKEPRTCVYQYANSGNESDGAAADPWGGPGATVNSRGSCHSEWVDCNSFGRALLDAAVLETQRKFSLHYAMNNLPWGNKPFMTVGTVCEAKCLGIGQVDEKNKQQLRASGFLADFTCGEDGTWKGELLCPDVQANSALQLDFARASTSSPSMWRAENHTSLQPRWQLSAVEVPNPTGAAQVKCDWIDTHAIRGSNVWVFFELRTDNRDLDKFNASMAPTVHVYNAVYTDSDGSNVQYAEMYVVTLSDSSFVVMWL